MLKVKMTVNLCWVKFEDLMMNNEDLRESLKNIRSFISIFSHVDVSRIRLTHTFL